MDELFWKIIAGVACFSTVALWREYTSRVKTLEARLTRLNERKWPELEDRLTSVELWQKAYDAEAEKAEKRYNKIMRCLNALLWAMAKLDNSTNIDPDALFRD